MPAYCSRFSEVKVASSSVNVALKTPEEVPIVRSASIAVGMLERNDGKVSTMSVMAQVTCSSFVRQSSSCSNAAPPSYTTLSPLRRFQADVTARLFCCNPPVVSIVESFGEDENVGYSWVLSCHEGR